MALNVTTLEFSLRLQAACDVVRVLLPILFPIEGILAAK
jgi:hypothetical protein